MMNNRHSAEIVEKYQNVIPEHYTPEDVARTQEFYGSLKVNALTDWVSSRMKPYRLGDQTYNMLVDIPLDWDEKSLVGTFTEFGTAMPLRFAAKSRLTRDMVNPRAALIAQPSSIQGELHMNYSNGERLQLWNGSMKPIVDRVLGAVDANFDGTHPSNVTLAGVSQGAASALAYAADERTPAAAVSAIEIPTVRKRSLPMLGLHFATCGGDIYDVVASNYNYHASEMAKKTQYDAEPLQLLKYSFKTVSADGLVTAAALRHNTAAGAIEVALDKGGSVVHSWGTVDKVSPAWANRNISDNFWSRQRYETHELKDIRHTVTDLYGVNAALARRARQLLNEN